MQVKELIKIIKKYPEYLVRVDASSDGTESDNISGNAEDVDVYDGLRVIVINGVNK